MKQFFVDYQVSDDVPQGDPFRDRIKKQALLSIAEELLRCEIIKLTHCRKYPKGSPFDDGIDRFRLVYTMRGRIDGD